jgi:DNA-binding NarL/FixJ family response regulator
MLMPTDTGDDVRQLRILLADDHRLMLAGIRRSLSDESDIHVVGEADCGTKVLPLIARTNPDVVLLDLRMPKLDGLTCLDLIRERYPDVTVIVLSVFSDSDHIGEALKRGAAGYIVKTVSPLELAPSIRQAVGQDGEQSLETSELAADTAAKQDGLTKREIEILKAVAHGLANQRIAEQLWVTEQTVKFHLTNIFRKLGVDNRTEAARYAYENRLVESTIADTVAAPPCTAASSRRRRSSRSVQPQR